MVLIILIPPVGGPSAPVGAALGPVGWVAIGAAADGEGVSWDCWRDILHDFETPAAENPHGRLLKDLTADPRVKEFRTEDKEDQPPLCWLKNKWDEEFRIDFVRLPDGEIAGHAVRIEP